MNHISDTLLAAFVDGTVGEHTSVEIALHLDDCPACANRATHLEPLGAAFAYSPDPVPPPDLVDAILVEARKPRAPERWPMEVSAGLALLAVATVLLLLTTDPLAAANSGGLWLDAIEVVSSSLARVVPTVTLTVCTVFAGIVLALTSGARPRWVR